MPSPEKQALKRLREVKEQVKSVDRYARQEGMSCLFVTITAPSCYHIYGNRENSNWDPKKSPNVTNDYIAGNWKKLSTRLSRCKLRRFVFRVVEHHADGTPHWHALIWCDADDKETVIGSINKYLNCDPKLGYEVNINLASDIPNDGYIEYVTKLLDAPDRLEKKAKNNRDYTRTWGIQSYRFTINPDRVSKLWRVMRKANSANYEHHEILSELFVCSKLLNFFQFLQIFFSREHDIPVD